MITKQQMSFYTNIYHKCSQTYYSSSMAYKSIVSITVSLKRKSQDAFQNTYFVFPEMGNWWLNYLIMLLSIVWYKWTSNIQPIPKQSYTWNWFACHSLSSLLINPDCLPWYQPCTAKVGLSKERNTFQTKKLDGFKPVSPALTFLLSFKHM